VNIAPVTRRAALNESHYHSPAMLLDQEHDRLGKPEDAHALECSPKEMAEVIPVTGHQHVGAGIDRRGENRRIFVRHPLLTGPGHSRGSRLRDNGHTVCQTFKSLQRTGVPTFKVPTRFGHGVPGCEQRTRSAVGQKK